MEEQKPKDKSQAKTPTIEMVIELQWKSIKTLEAMLEDPELTVAERMHIVEVYGDQLNTLTRVLAKRNEENLFDEQTLGDFVRDVEPRIARRFGRGYRPWRRKREYICPEGNQRLRICSKSA